MSADPRDAAIVDMLRAEARKAAVEHGAVCQWDADTATLLVPGAANGRAVQVSPLSGGDLDPLVRRLRTHPPAGAHTVFAYTELEQSPVDELQAMGFEPVVTAPLMVRELVPGPVAARAAVEADRAALAVLDPRAQAYRFDCDDVVTLLLDTEGGVAAKTQVVLSEAPRAYLGELVVAPSRRREGLGARLVADAERFAAARGCTSMVLVSTHEGRPLYRAMGYRTVAWVHVLQRPAMMRA